ncbi:inner membrane protein import complex subunit Tim54-domain-containing protein [Endogone sp. FLAS-F59071]|nr:inner membrane protein import complex subunit Tim54-domain-containing protein [Endogone sp. FLAS-F59071]|eukprot:RUS18694.1 inner membrane protein import complex subunit Tim54-domain-containing protein [Endogone sp. FLAS-F59071]
MTSPQQPNKKTSSSVIDVNNQETPAFGSRLLKDRDAVFEHNAWDNVEWDIEQEEYAKKQIERHAENPVPPEEQDKYHAEAAEYWNKFYQKNDNRFFKDRHWLRLEFPELFQTADENAGKKVVMEIGCGAGNTMFPLLQESHNPHLFVYACDFSSTAVDVVKSNPSYDSKSSHVFVWDLTSSTLPEFIELGSVDVVVLIFVLSAIRPEHWNQAVENLYKLLKPGGLVVFRDYGRYDLAQLRFKEGRMLSDNFYIRGDGTRVYFFTTEEIEHIFSRLHEDCRFAIEQNAVDRRLIVNRSRKLKMYRVWLQGKFRKPSLWLKILLSSLATRNPHAPLSMSFPFKIKPPSKGTTIFLAVVGSVGSVLYRDRVKTAEAREALAARVRHLAEEPLGPRELPRKIIVYLTAPPGDGIDKTRLWFRNYVKPLLVAAALDYEVKEGKVPGTIQSMVSEEIRRRRKVAAGLAPDPLSAGGHPLIAQPRPELEGIVCIGRQTWREVLNGLDEGCRASLTDEVVESNVKTDEEARTAAESGDSSSKSKDEMNSSPPPPPPPPENLPKVTSTPSLTQYVPIEDKNFSLPPSFAALGYIPHQNLVGWGKVPQRLFLWVNDYIRVHNVGEYVVRIALGKTRAFRRGEDEEVGVDERALWTTEGGKQALERDQVVLDERIGEKLEVYTE